MNVKITRRKVQYGDLPCGETFCWQGSDILCVKLNEECYAKAEAGSEGYSTIPVSGRASMLFVLPEGRKLLLGPIEQTSKKRFSDIQPYEFFQVADMVFMKTEQKFARGLDGGCTTLGENQWVTPLTLVGAEFEI